MRKGSPNSHFLNLPLLNTAVDFRTSLRFPRAGREPPRRIRVCGVSRFPLFPQDKEGCGSDASHEGNAVAFSRSLRLVLQSTAKLVSKSTIVFNKAYFYDFE